MLPGAHFIWT
jgi:hypothetical protein